MYTYPMLKLRVCATAHPFHRTPSWCSASSHTEAGFPSATSDKFRCQEISKKTSQEAMSSIYVGACMYSYCSVSHSMFWQDALPLKQSCTAAGLDTSQIQLKSQLFKEQNIPIPCQTELEVLKHVLNYEILTLREHRHMFMFLSTV